MIHFSEILFVLYFIGLGKATKPEQTSKVQLTLSTAPTDGHEEHPVERPGDLVALHVTAESLNIDNKNLYQLSPPIDVALALSALHGVPEFHFPKPEQCGMEIVDGSSELSDTSSKETVRAMKLESAIYNGGVPPVTLVRYVIRPLETVQESHSKEELMTGREFEAEYLPIHYVTLPYIFFQLTIFGFASPYSVYLLARGKRNPSRLYPTVVFLFVFFTGLIAHSKFSVIPLWISAVMCFFFATMCSFFSMTSFGLTKYYPEKFSVGELTLVLLFLALLSNMVYQVLSALVPYPLGLSGLFSDRIYVAQIGYWIWLFGFSSLLIYLQRGISNSIRQNIQLTCVTAYFILAGAAYFVDLLFVHIKAFASLIALDPLGFFSVVPILRLNLPTVIFLTVFLVCWTAGFRVHQKEDLLGVPETTAIDSLEEALNSVAAIGE